jgi:hypothetical protein
MAIWKIYLIILPFFLRGEVGLPLVPKIIKNIVNLPKGKHNAEPHSASAYFPLLCTKISMGSSGSCEPALRE